MMSNLLHSLDFHRLETRHQTTPKSSREDRSVASNYEYVVPDPIVSLDGSHKVHASARHRAAPIVVRWHHVRPGDNPKPQEDNQAIIELLPIF